MPHHASKPTPGEPDDASPWERQDPAKPVSRDTKPARAARRLGSSPAAATRLRTTQLRVPRAMECTAASARPPPRDNRPGSGNRRHRGLGRHRQSVRLGHRQPGGEADRRVGRASRRPQSSAGRQDPRHRWNGHPHFLDFHIRNSDHRGRRHVRNLDVLTRPQIRPYGRTRRRGQPLTISRIRAMAPSNATSVRSPERRSLTSITPEARPLPTTTMVGTPTSSASLNLTPGDTLRRSS